MSRPHEHHLDAAQAYTFGADTPSEREFRRSIYRELKRLASGAVLLDDISDVLFELATRIRVRYGTQDAAGELWSMWDDLEELEFAEEVVGE